jgi:hypothetical protein
MIFSFQNFGFVNSEIVRFFNSIRTKSADFTSKQSTSQFYISTKTVEFVNPGYNRFYIKTEVLNCTKYMYTRLEFGTQWRLTEHESELPHEKKVQCRRSHAGVDPFDDS